MGKDLNANVDITVSPASSETNDDGVVSWNVKSWRAGAFPIKVVANNGVENTTSAHFV